jgi:hypothetical protein
MTRRYSIGAGLLERFGAELILAVQLRLPNPKEHSTEADYGAF